MDEPQGKDADVSAWSQDISAITLFIEDLDASKLFYQKVFGLPVVFEDQNSTVFSFGNTVVNLLTITEADELITPATVASRKAGARQVFTLEVDDVDATLAELTRRGVTLLNGPVDRPWGVRTASFQDPAGYIWELAK